MEELLTHYRRGQNQYSFDIDNPVHVREYYERLFQETRDHLKLRKALEERDFAETDRQYQLIANQGCYVIVPYDKETALYESVCKEARKGGLTNSLIRQAAPITVTTFEKNLECFAEQLYFRMRHGQPEAPSNYYLLLPKYEERYTPDMGLQFEQKEE